MDKRKEMFQELYLMHFLSLLVSAVIGLIIGLERELDTKIGKENFAGISTFPVVAILGSLASFLSDINHLIVPVSLAGFFIFISVAYFTKGSRNSFEMKTEVALLVAFVLGILSAKQLYGESLAATILIVAILSFKERYRDVISQITREELFAFVKFSILTLLIFIFLPDKTYGPGEIYNPREVGEVVVVVSSLSFIGYLLMKFGGAQKGILLTAFFGGLFSSTAVAWVFSSKSGETGKNESLYSAGITLASSIMFLRVLVLIFIFNKSLLSFLALPCLLLFVAGGLVTFFLTKRAKKSQDKTEIILGNPIDMLNALGFGLIYLGILTMVHFAGQFFGTRGLYLSGIISGLADVDAISISMAKYGQEPAKVFTSTSVIITAILSNTLVKMGIAIFRGSLKLKKEVGVGLGVLIGVGIIYMLVSIGIFK